MKRKRIIIALLVIMQMICTILPLYAKEDWNDNVISQESIDELQEIIGDDFVIGDMSGTPIPGSAGEIMIEKAKADGTYDPTPKVINKKPLEVAVNGKILKLDKLLAPYYCDGAKVPLKPVCNALGIKVKWIGGPSGTFELTSKDGKTIVKSGIGISEGTINGVYFAVDEEFPVNVLNLQKDGRIFVSYKFFVKAFGLSASYENKTVYLSE